MEGATHLAVQWILMKYSTIACALPLRKYSFELQVQFVEQEDLSSAHVGRRRIEMQRASSYAE